MPSTRSTLIFDNTSTPAVSGQFGPLTVTVGTSLLKVRAIGSYINPLVSLNTSAVLTNDTTWGIQWGVSGYTPHVLPADIDDPSFLVANQRVDGVTSVAWAPSTDTAAYTYTSALDLEWDGQLFIGNTIDLYFTYGPSHGSGLNATVHGTLQAFWQ